MKIQHVLGFFIIFWQCNAFWGFSVFSTQQFELLYHLSGLYNIQLKCKRLEDTPLLRLKRKLLCNYDSSIHPNHFKNNATVVTLRLMPKLMELENRAVLSLHSWITLTWSDPQLMWTPRNYDGINFVNVNSWEIWTPNLYVYNFGDMSEYQLELPEMKCLFFNEGFVSCVPAVKFVAKCDPDYTDFPYEKYQCRITFSSWRHTGDIQVDYQLDGDGITMDGYQKNAMWDLKFINVVKEMKTHKCCPNDTFPTIDYNFLLTRYYHTNHIINTIPAIVLIFLTLTVLCLDPKSVERIALASVNFICHLLCLYHMYWHLPYNGINIPKIFIFYGESVVLAALVIVLTMLLRKLEDMNTKMPNWISSMTMFVLSNNISRFLILKDNEIKVADENIVTEENSNVPKSETEMKAPSWRHFTTIIDWLSFICVILTYIITLIIFVPIS